MFKNYKNYKNYEGIHNPKGIYQSVKICLDKKKCYDNLTKRVPLISEKEKFNECLKEWSHIIGYKDGRDNLITSKNLNLRKSHHSKIPELCLCGMIIKDIYYIINDKTKEIAQIGAKCIERIDPEMMKKYKESLKVKYYCDICETNSKDKEKHLLTKKHINNYKKFNEKRIMILNEHIWRILGTRKCMNCTNRIKLTEPKWKKICIKCWKKSKNFH